MPCSITLERSQKGEAATGFVRSMIQPGRQCGRGSQGMAEKRYSTVPAGPSPKAPRSPGPHALHCINSSEYMGLMTDT